MEDKHGSPQKKFLMENKNFIPFDFIYVAFFLSFYSFRRMYVIKISQI